jgi:hypothetical protein
MGEHENARQNLTRKEILSLPHERPANIGEHTKKAKRSRQLSDV